MIDLLIIGGGINGVGIAADAAGRGLCVTLCEQSDLASNTSSKSSKLIHGGLRYLEHGEFRLVREALLEREVLWRKAPHLIAPLRFVMPHDTHLKPACILKIGLFLYDHLAKRNRLPSSENFNLQHHAAGKILKKKFTRGFAYSDCWVDDARLVVANAIAAKEKGADILLRTRFIEAKREQDHWEATLENVRTKTRQTIKAKVIINTSGPWVNTVIQQHLKLTSKNYVSLVKGSHIIVPKLYEGTFAFILVNTDNRVVFIIPYLGKYSLIGTTDIAFTGDPFAPTISDEEIDYLCAAVNHYFEKPISVANIVHTYAGIRPLHSEDVKNLSAITRDYAFELNDDQGKAPLLSVFGGKITTYRKLAEHTLEKLRPYFPAMGESWTKNAVLPGGDIGDTDIGIFEANIQQKYPWLPSYLTTRYTKQFGTRIEHLLIGCTQLVDLGRHFGAGLYERELEYLINEEWASSTEDILWRRTKLGLDFTPQEAENLETVIKEKLLHSY